jgi:hypothetical protein
MTKPNAAEIKRPPNGRCASCLHTGPDVTIAMAKVHGALPLCEKCRDYADDKGWLRT